MVFTFTLFTRVPFRRRAKCSSENELEHCLNQDLQDSRIFRMMSLRVCERVSLASVRAFQRSRGTGPRTTGKKTACVTVGRGPVPRHRSREKKTSLVLFRSVGPKTASCRWPTRGKPARMRVWHPRAPALRKNRDPRSLLPRGMMVTRSDKVRELSVKA